MNGLLNYLLEGSLILGVGLLFYKVLLERLTFFHWNRIFLLALLGCVFILPVINLDVSIDTGNPVQAINKSLNIIAIQPDSDASRSSSLLMNWSGVVALIYLVGVLFFGVKLMLGLLRTIQQIYSSVKIKVGKNHIVLNSKFPTASFFNYILLPSYNPDCPVNRQVVIHESVHVQKLHSLDILLAQFAKVIFWFNPLIYVFEKSLREIHEFQADQVVTHSYSPIAYSRLLLKQLSADCEHQYINNFNQFQTKKRIIMMNKTKSNRLLRSRFLLTIPLMALMIGLFSCDMAGGNEKITGTWRGSDFSFEQIEGTDMSAIIEGGKQLHLNSKLRLNEDGTYEISINQQENGSGTWELTNDELTTIDSNGNKVVYTIKDLTDNELVTIQQVETDTPMGAVSGKITLTYTR